MRPTLLLCVCVLLYISTGTLAGGGCNGHGYQSGDSPSHCVCEGPYTGNECDTCQDGYYGDPRDGEPCFLTCHQSRHLTHFTTAGVGVTNEFLYQAPPDPRGHLCVWVIDPLSQINLEEYFGTDSNQSLAISLHINSSPFNTFSENLLIYQQLPSFLEFTNPLLFNSSSSLMNQYNSHHHGNSPPLPDSRHHLLYSLRGGQLRGNALTLPHSVVTVVYLYHGNGEDDQGLAGLNITVSVGNDSLRENTSDSDVITRESPYLQPTLLIPSLLELLTQQSNTLYDESSSQVSANNMTHLNLTLNETDTQNCSSYTCPPPLNGKGVEVCRGRYWHSSVYDSLTTSLWLFGGVDVTGVVCDGVTVVNVSQVTMEIESCEGCVRRVSGGESEPSGRYLHTAVLARCPNNTLDNGSSCMVVFGGFPSNSTLSMPSRESWLYNGHNESWTRLADAPLGLAAHSSVMVGNNTMLVLGGLRSGQLSSVVLTYSVDVGVWDVWRSGAVPGSYGHSAVYDNSTNSVYLYGGVVYSPPTADISSSLFVLELDTRNWAEIVLSVQVPGRAFHSLLLTNQTLFITGGLVKSGPSLFTTYPGLDSLTYATTSLLIDVGGRCDSEKSVLVSDGGVAMWGHSAVWYEGERALVSGGFDGTSVDSVSLLTVPSHISCSLAQTLDQCRTLPFCESCVNSTDFIGCFHADERWLCNSTDTQVVPTATNCSIGQRRPCSQFGDCWECLSADIAQELGCVWCGCDDQPGPLCVDTPTNCSCDRVASSYKDIPQVCPLDVCHFPSCQECLDDANCGWTFFGISSNLAQTGLIPSLIIPNHSWSCHSNNINRLVGLIAGYQATTISTCSSPCDTANTCDECLGRVSSNGGPLYCVWAVHTHTCMSHDLAPLACANGLCGGFVTNSTQCPLPCSVQPDCPSCLSDPLCRYYVAINGDGHIAGQCTNAANSLSAVETVLDGVRSDNVSVHSYYNSPCPGCANGCSGRGTCLFAELMCECDLGYVGGDCSVECECNRLSTCANVTEEGRRECLHCQQNTQGPSCNQCNPFSVGHPGNGVGCIPCNEYCHGNSHLCLRRSELNNATERNFTLSRTQLLGELVESGPSEEESVCVDCEDFSTGDSCNTCLHGYYNKNVNSSSPLVSCVGCTCNGHGDCNPDSGVCGCQNNTHSDLCEGTPCSLELQCNLCTEGFIGAPSDYNQCYRELAIEQLNNFTILPKQSLTLAIGLDYYFSNVDVQIHFKIIYGELEIYDALNNRAVFVTVNQETFHHEANVGPGYEFTRLTRDAPCDNIVMETHPHSASKRQGSGTGDALSRVFVHKVTGSRYILVISSDQARFQVEQHFLTILAGSIGARFFVYYKQESSSLNYFIFSSVLISCFFLTFGIALLFWKAIKLEIGRRSRANEQRLQIARTRRPFAKVPVFFDRKNLRGFKEKFSNPIFMLKPPIKESTIGTTPTHLAMGNKEQQVELQPIAKKPRKIGRKRKNIADPCDLTPWPVARQTLRDEQAAVSTVLIKLPSKSKTSGGHVICTGSCLIRQPKEEGKKKWKRRNNRCAPTDYGGLEMEVSSDL